MEYWADVIKAVTSLWGLIALIVLVIFALAVIFFHAEKVGFRILIFMVVLTGAGFLLAPLITESTAKTVTSTTRPTVTPEATSECDGFTPEACNLLRKYFERKGK